MVLNEKKETHIIRKAKRKKTGEEKFRKQEGGACQAGALKDEEVQTEPAEEGIYL